MLLQLLLLLLYAYDKCVTVRHRILFGAGAVLLYVRTHKYPCLVMLTAVTTVSAAALLLPYVRIAVIMLFRYG